MIKCEHSSMKMAAGFDKGFRLCHVYFKDGVALCENLLNQDKCPKEHPEQFLAHEFRETKEVDDE